MREQASVVILAFMFEGKRYLPAVDEVRELGAGIARQRLIRRRLAVLAEAGGGSSAARRRSGLTGVADLRRVNAYQAYVLAIGQNQGIAIDDMPDLGNFRGGGDGGDEEGTKQKSAR